MKKELLTMLTVSLAALSVGGVLSGDTQSTVAHAQVTQTSENRHIRKLAINEGMPTHVVNTGNAITPNRDGKFWYGDRITTVYAGGNSKRNKALLNVAMQNWNKYLGGKVVLKLQNSPVNADITYKVSRDLESNTSFGNGLVGVQTPTLADSTHNRNYSQIMFDMYRAKKFGLNTSRQVLTVEHELGHALGLADSSNSFESIMNGQTDAFTGISTADVKGVLKYQQEQLAE